MKRYLLICLLLLIFSVFWYQCSSVVEKIPLKIPKLSPNYKGILKGKPAISTSISDAVTEVPFIDNFEPKDFVQMSTLPRGPHGEFIIEHPGLYEFKAQSYCLQPGTHGPGKGNGYLYAPLKGARADIVGNILRNSYLHPEIPQRDIQVLLWAVIARTKIKDMPRKYLVTAAKLLTPKEILELNGGALGLIPQKVLDKISSNLPPLVRQTLEAEARLRKMLIQGPAAFREIERVAVLTGVVPKGEGSRNVPSGRWSYHPDGYFARYFPSGYSRTNIQIYVPGKIRSERDQLGRITSLDDNKGNRIETDYDDTIQPLVVSTDDGVNLIAYAFRSVRIIYSDPITGELSKKEWNNVGWTFVKQTSDKTSKSKGINNDLHSELYVNLENTAIRSPRGPYLDEMNTNHYFDSPDSNDGCFTIEGKILNSKRFKGIKNRLKKINKWVEEFNKFKDVYDKYKKYKDLTEITPEEAFEEFISIKHYQDGLDTLFDHVEMAEWLARHGVLMRLTIEYICNKLAELFKGESKSTPIDDLNDLEIDLTDDTAIPVNTSRQRLGQSGRGG